VPPNTGVVPETGSCELMRPPSTSTAVDPPTNATASPSANCFLATRCTVARVPAADCTNATNGAFTAMPSSSVPRTSQLRMTLDSWT